MIILFIKTVILFLIMLISISSDSSLSFYPWPLADGLKSTFHLAMLYFYPFFFHFTFAHHSNLLGLDCSKAVRTIHDPTSTWQISEASAPDALWKYDIWKYLFSSAFRSPHTHTTSLNNPSNASACYPVLFSSRTSKDTLLQTH